MYNAFFGFDTQPFDIVPNPDVLFMSRRHKIALDYLEYGLSSGAGFILLTGEIGTGKTTLVRRLLRGPSAAGSETAVIFQTDLTPEDLIGMLLTEFELPPKPGDKPAALASLNDFFLKCFARDRKVLIVVDEAQNLSVEVLEELRLLSNLQGADRVLLQIILVGQPELERRLKEPRLAQLAQRIAVNYHLSALEPEETAEYIAYRLKRAGGPADLFDAEAARLVHAASGGVPRAINLLCGGALLYAYADGRHAVSVGDVQRAVAAKDGLGGVRSVTPVGGKVGAAAAAPDVAADDARTASIRPEPPSEGPVAAEKSAGAAAPEEKPVAAPSARPQPSAAAQPAAPTAHFAALQPAAIVRTAQRLEADARAAAPAGLLRRFFAACARLFRGK